MHEQDSIFYWSINFIERRARMFSMLLAAKASGTPVIVAYSDVGGCEPWGADQNAYRKIIRLR